MDYAIRPSKPAFHRQTFGVMPSGQKVELIRLSAGVFDAEIITFGAALRAFRGPDRQGRQASVVLGYRTLEDYILGNERQGATMGRFVNRIGGASFSIDGKDYPLFANDGTSSIHGGLEGFDRRVWDVFSNNITDTFADVCLSLVSPDGDQGFPGTVHARSTYRLDIDGRLTITLEGQTDAPTVLNMTNHAYFNLRGEGSGSILDHQFTIATDRYLPVNDDILPTGGIEPVAGTVFDFRQSAPFIDRIRSDHEQLRLGRGFDHCYVLAMNRRPQPVFAARVSEPESGRILEVLTTEPGLQLHSGNVLSGRFCGDAGRAYRQSDGFCLEAQHFPDAPNKPMFPSAALHPGETYKAVTIYRLGAA